jgi:hypothetical protein
LRTTAGAATPAHAFAGLSYRGIWWKHERVLVPALLDLLGLSRTWYPIHLLRDGQAKYNVFPLAG